MVDNVLDKMFEGFPEESGEKLLEIGYNPGKQREKGETRLTPEEIEGCLLDLVYKRLDEEVPRERLLKFLLRWYNV